MKNQIKNSSYTVMLCLKDKDGIDIHALSSIVDKFNELFTCISDFATEKDDCVEEPASIITSIYGNQILFTIDSNGKNRTHEYMLRNLDILLLCFDKNKAIDYHKKCHATVRYRVRELLQAVQDIGVTEIRISDGKKTYTEKDINEFLRTNDDYRGAKMSIDVQKGMKYLEEILSEVMCIVDTAGKKNKFYENPQFIFRGITQFYPSEEDVKNGINAIKGIDKNIPLEDEIEYVRKDLIKSSLAVRLRDTSAAIVENRAYIRAHYVDALETMIRKAKNMYPNKYTAEMSDLDVLADIQHYGGATCLVDFSKNILTSIWFACSTHPDSNGFLYCYNVTEDMIYNDALTQVREEDEKRNIHDLLAQTYKETNVCSDVDTRFCLWEPSKKNNRIFRQDSVFLFGIEPFKVNEHAISVIGIKAEWKQKILAAMKSIFNISGSTVYSDYVGFANNADKARPYRKMGESTYTRGYANMIQGNYWSAMEFLKLSEVDAYKETWDIRKLLELHFSLGVCYKGLGKQEKTEYYRENALLEYSHVIKLARDIIEDRTIKKRRDYYQHKVMRSYNAKISLMYDLGRYEDAITECEAVKKEIEEKDGLLNDYNNNQMQLTSKYCDVSILELQVLELLSHCKKRDVLNKKVKRYNWNKCCAAKEDKMDFWTLLKEYYSKIIEIIYLKEYTKKNVKNDIDNWNIRAQGYFKCKETYDNNYIPWNFEDIKKIIDAIPADSILSEQKEILQDLTAGVISLRDTYEIYAWWSNEKL